MIELKKFSFGYRGSNKGILLRDVSVGFSSGRLTALIGRNGSGKSTLLRVIAGIKPDYEGEVLIDGESLKSISHAELAKKLAFVNTERVRIPNFKCRDVVALGRSPYTDWIGRLSAEDEQIIDNALSLCGMEDFAERTMDSMSDGECQRVMIARAIAQDTPNILLDEPTSFLDLPARYKLVELLHSLAENEGKAIVFSTHELDIALKCCDDVALIADSNLYNLSATEMAASDLIPTRFGITLHSRQ